MWHLFKELAKRQNGKPKCICASKCIYMCFFFRIVPKAVGASWTWSSIQSPRKSIESYFQILKLWNGSEGKNLCGLRGIIPNRGWTAERTSGWNKWPWINLTLADDTTISKYNAMFFLVVLQFLHSCSL